MQGGSEGGSAGGSADISVNPGDVIVSVGNIPCSDLSMSLEEMTELAYRNNILKFVVLDGTTGRRVTVALPPLDEEDDQQSGK
jgi:hypothetical protein